MPYIGNTIRAADDYRLIDDISSGFNGSTTSFALQVAGSAPVPFPKSPQQVLISVNGVIQEPDPTGASGFNLVGTNIVFSSAPTNGHAFFGIIYATADYLNAGGNFPAGSLGAPSITFIGDENSGLFRKSGGSVGFVSDATEIANFDSNGITISSGNLIIPDSIIHNGDANTKIRFPAADTITAETGGSERIRINSAGAVMVGGTLQAGSNGGLNAEVTSSANHTTVLALINQGTADDSGVIISHRGKDDAGNQHDYNYIRMVADDTGSGSEDGSIRFWTLGAGTLGERLRITSTGNVGIGTTSPACGLHIDNPDNAAITQILDTDNSAVKLVFRNSTETGNNMQIGADGSNLVALTGATERMRIDSSGNVGIGTTSPAVKLDVNGKIHAATSIGIRTTSPQCNLHVHQGDSGSVFAKFTNSTTTISSTRGLDIGIDSSEQGFFNLREDKPFVCEINGGERLRIDSSGNVGIGTTSTGSYPVSATARKVQFEVRGQINTSTNVHQGTMALNCTNASSALHIVRSDNDQTNGRGIGQVVFVGYDGTDFHPVASINAARDDTGANNDQPGRLEFLTTADGASQATERMRIDKFGNVGIGTVPIQDWKFQVFGGRTTFTDPNSVYTIGLRKNSTNNNNRNVWLGASAANDNSNPDFIISDNAGTEKFRFRTSGGLAFNGDSAAANGLDDYEEGTFTVGFKFSNQSFNGSLSTSQGFYTKIGNRCNVALQLVVSDKGTNTSGGCTITGLPFTVLNADNGRASGVVGYHQGTSGIDFPIQILVEANQTEFPLRQAQATSNALDASNISNGFRIYISISYFTA